VREVIVIDRDTRRVELFRLAGSQYAAATADRDGWLTSETLRVRFRLGPGSKALSVEDVLDASVRVEI
jgi:hypothetical protein